MKAYLHIGTEKTGTTAIQYFLVSNRKYLLEDGFLYPHSPEETKEPKLAPFAHTKIAAFSMKANPLQDIHKYLQITNAENFLKLQNNFQNELAQELNQTKATTVVFSNEHCSSRLFLKEEIERLRKLLEPFFEEIKIIIYLRRQDKFLLSTYSTSVIGGHTKPFELPSKKNIEQRYDYWNILKKWESVFGRENVIVRIFEREQMFGGDLLSDFTNLLKIDSIQKYKTAKTLNESLDADSLEYLRLINHYVPRFIDNDINQNRVKILHALRNYSKYYSNGTYSSMPKEMVENFMLNFEESNKQVANYFLNCSDGKLFKNDFHSEDNSSYTKLTIKKAFEITTYLLKDRIKQMYQLRREN
jgi:hypothetical protein